MKTKTATSTERTLREGERRFVVKAWGSVGRKVTHWGIYDRQRASWPHALAAPFGLVHQSHKTEESAQAEADRLEALR